MYEIDHYTMQELGMDGRILMENAGREISHKIRRIADKENKILVLIGPGNNGGDGFVIARNLLNAGYRVNVLQVVANEKISGDAFYHKQLFLNFGGKVSLEIDTIQELVEQSDIVVDAILGIGVKGNLKEPLSKVVSIINQSDVCVVSVDIPSGLPADEGSGDFTAIEADYTFLVGAVKQSAFLTETEAYYGKWETVSIGFPRRAFQEISCSRIWTEKEFRKTLPPRKKHAHKGNHGRGLIIGGSSRMPGSIGMTTKAALKAGAGLITAGTIDEVISIIAPTCPEAMYLPLAKKDGYVTRTSALPLEDYNAIALGIGMGRRIETTELVHDIVQDAPCPIILDADGLYHMKRNISLLKERKATTILTPHPGEMAMLLNISVAELLAESFRYTRDFAREHDVFVLLKGKHTIITSPDGIQAVESSGNPGLAKGGSGDVLTGIVLAMIMQNQHTFEALCNACFIQGKSADLQVGESHSSYDLLASDVIAGISNVYRTFM